MSSDEALLEKHRIEQGSFTSAAGNGETIYFRHYFPQEVVSDEVIHLVFQHGMVEHQSLHLEFFKFLRDKYKNKLIISAMDLVGHGHSTGLRSHVEDFDIYLKDMKQFLDLSGDMLEEHAQVSQFIVGHSLGGLIAIKTVLKYKGQFESLRGLILTNPCLGPKIELPKKSMGVIEKMTNSLQKIKLPSLYGGKQLTHVDSKAQRFNHDPLVSKTVSVQLLVELYKACSDIFNESYFFPVKSLFVLSGEDFLVDNDKTELFITGMKKNLAEVKRYPGMYHDILNETCRKKVYTEVEDYINRIVSYE